MTEPYEAVEIIVQGMRIAWTVDDEVFVHTGDTSQREDGFVLIGMLPWDADYKTHIMEQMENENRLREFVQVWIDGMNALHGTN